MTTRSITGIRFNQRAKAKPRAYPFRRLRSRPTSLTWSVLVAFGVASGNALANPAAGIVIDGRTQTQVIQTAPGVVDIHTGTVRGNNAFNSFSQFNVGNGEVANLHLPSNTANLINLVRDGRTTIDGMLNAIRDGKIGGNVYFANPHGFIVSASGVVNVGNLHVSTPTHSFIDNFFDGLGNPDDASVALLLGGKAPRNALGVITIDGQVNAVDGITLSAGAINVGGAIFSDAQFITAEPAFTDVVNATGLASATGVVERDGRIEIVADHTVRIAGTAGVGAHRVEGGLVSITAGGQIELLDGAYVGASDDVLLTAKNDGGELDVLSGTRAAISLNSATLRGRNVTLEASSTHVSTVSPLVTKTVEAQIDVVDSTLEASEDLTLKAKASVDVTTSGNSPIGTVDVASVAGVDVRGTSSLSSGGDTRLEASSSVKAVVKPGLPDLGELPGDAGVAVVVVDSRATSDLRGNATAAAGGSLDLAAINTVDVEAVTDASAAGSTAVGGTVSVAVVDTTTRAAIGGNATVTSAASVNVNAESINRILVSATAAAGGATGKGEDNSKTEETLADYQGEASTTDGGVKVAAAVAVSDLTSRTEATLSSSGSLTSTGAVSVGSHSLNQTDVTADGSSVQGGVGVGVGVAINLVDSLNQASVTQRVSTGAGLNVEAGLPSGTDINSFRTIAKSGAGASNVGVAGSLAVTVIENRTHARYGFGGSVPGGTDVLGPVRITARNESESETSAAPLDGGASGETVGIGASVAVHTATNETLAEIANGAVLNDAGNITVQATGKHATEVSAEAGAAGGVGLTPVVAVAVVDNATLARIGTGSVLEAGGNVSLTATHSGTTTTSATADVAGEKAAIGAAVAVTVVSDAVSASTARSITAGGDIGFAAHGDATSSSFAMASAKGGKNDESGNAQDDGVDQEVGKQLALGKDRQAAGSNADQSPASAETAGEGGNASKVSVAAAIAVNVAESEARAAVLDGANIQANSGALTLSASGNTDASATADGSAVGDSAVGIGAAVAINTAAANTVAYLGAGMHAVKGLNIEAGMTDKAGDETNTFVSKASSGAGSGKVGVAGSLALNIIDTRNVASLSKDAVVNAGNGDVTLTASNASTSNASALPAEDVTTAGSKLGIGASVAVNVVSNESRAELTDGAVLIGGKDLSVNADGTYAATTEAEAGSEGGISITPVVAVSVIDNQTTARLGTGAGLDLAGNVSVQAAHTAEVTTSAKGSSKGDKAAIGAAVAVSITNDSALATTARNIEADGSIRFAALTSQASTTTAIASAKGGKQEKKTGASDDTPADGVDQEVAKQASFGQAKQRDGSDTKTKAPESAQTSEGKVSVAAAVAVTAADVSSEAYIADGLTIIAGDAVTVEATGNTDATTRADGSAVGSTTTVGIGAGVAINSATSATHAWIGDASITSNGLTVRAGMTDNGGDGSSDFLAEAKSGGGSGSIGIAGSLALNIIDNISVAEVSSGAVVNAGTGNVTLSADNDSTSSVHALPAEDAASATNEKVGIGASVAINVVFNESRAELKDGARLAGGDDLTVTASGNYVTTTEAEAGSAGGISVTPVAAVSVVDNLTIARLGTGHALDLDGNVSVQATHDSKNTTTAKGSSQGEKAAVGAAVAVSIANDSALAATERDITADGSVRFASLMAQSSITSATASAKGGKAEKKTGAADDTPDDGVDKEIGKQASFGQAKQRDGSDTKTKTPESAQTSEGKVSVAAAVGVTASDVSSEAYIADGLNVAAGGAVTVEASGNTDATTSADGSAAGSTATVGIGAGVAINTINAETHAWIGNANVTANGVTVRSFMTDKAGDTTNTFGADAKSGGGSGSIGIAGSLALNIVDTRSIAEVSSGANIHAGNGDVVLSAASDTSSIVEALPAADTASATNEKVGIGASVAVNVVSNETRAELRDGATLTGGDNVTVSAAGTYAATTKAEAGSAGGISLTPVAAVSVIDNQTIARLGSGNGLDVSGDVTVEATHTSTNITEAKGSSKGETAAIGIAVAVAVTNDSAQATTARNLDADGSVRFAAFTSQSSNTKATASAKGGKAEQKTGAADDTPEDGVDQQVDQQASFGQSKQRTDSSTKTQKPGSAQTSEGKVSVAAAVGVTAAEVSSEASIGNGLTIKAGDGLTVEASGNTDAITSADGSSAGSTAMVGIGAAVAINSINADTHAWIGNNANITANGVTVRSFMTEVAGDKVNTIDASAKAGAAGGKVGIAGALALNLVDVRNTAEIRDGVTIDADGGNVVVSADTATTTTATALPDQPATGGKVGVGASVALNLFGEEITRARIGSGVRLNDANDLSVSAAAKSDTTATAEAGAAGSVAIDAVVAMSDLKLQTVAIIDSGTSIDADGDVEISAVSSGTHSATATGDVKSDNVGIGASAAIILSNTSTRAALEGDLTSGGDLTVHAGAARTYEAVAKASAGGGKSDDEMSQSEKDKASSTNTLQKTEGQQQRGTDVASQAESDSAGGGASSGGGKVSAAAAAGVMVIDDDVSASIAAGRTLDVGGDLTVSATNSSDFSARGLGDAIDITKLTSGSKVGIGVGVGIAILNNDTEASIGDGTTIVQAGDISVQAESKQNTNPAFANKLAAEGVAGAGSEKVSVAGALALVLSDGSTEASIGDNVTISDADDIRITVDNTSKLAAKAWSVATSGKVGVGASVAVLVAENEYQAFLGQGANVTANSLAVAARNHEFNGPVNFDWKLDGLEERFTEANLQILLGQNNYYTEAIAGAAAGDVALSGAFSVNIFDDTTEAWVGEGSTLTLGSTGALDLTASNETTAKAFAGGVAASKKVGVGLASATIVNDGVTRAWLADGVQVLQAGSVSLSALSTMDLAVIGASAGLAGKAGIAGVANVIHTQNLVEASIGDNVRLNSNGVLALSAENRFEALNVAGVAGVGGTAGVGVSAGINLVDNQTRASIGNNADISVAGAASIDAESSVDVLSVVVGGAGGGKVGVAASAATNIYKPVTEAWIGENTRFNAAAPLLAQSVRVSAESVTDLFSIVGTVGVGGKVGVGGAADVVVIDKNTKAWIGQESVVRAAQDIAVLADSHETIRSNGVGFAAGGAAGVQGSASVVVLTTDTQAWADDETELFSNGNIVIAASGSSDLNLVAGAASASGGAAVGAGAAVAVVDKTTRAWIGDDASVTALGNAAAATVETGEFTVNYANTAVGEGEVSAPGVTPSNGEDELSGGSEALQKTRTATGNTTTLQGLAVTAVNQDSVKGFAVTGAGAGSVAVTLSGEVSVHSTTTSASIGNNTSINADNSGAGAAQSVLVAAGNDSFHLGVAGALSVGGTAGVGVGADVSVMNHDTRASIGNASDVNARKDVIVQATSTQDVVSVSTSLGASGTVGVAGSVSVLHFDNETWAWIGNGATVDAGGNVAVNASDDTATTLVVGGVGVGLTGGGVGAGVGVTIIDKDTRAWVGNGATVDARGQGTSDLTGYSGNGFSATESLRGLQVQALSSEDLFTVSAAGGAGLYVGLAGAVSVATIDSDTLAYLGDGVRVNTGVGAANAAQDVNVTARNDLSLFNVTGALGVGAVGIAGAVDVGVIRNDTTAFIGDGAVINAARDVDVNALSNKGIETYVVSASGGLASIAAGIAVYSVGGALDGESRGRLDTDDGDSAGTYADKQATDSSVTDSFLADYDDANIRSASDKVRTARNGTGVSDRFTANESRDLPSGNAAFVGENTSINAGRNVTVNAREFVDFDMTTGALAIGAVGLGAGVGVANFMNNNLASVHGGAAITAGPAGTFGVNAQLVENIDALSIAGTGGIVAVDAAVAVLTSNGSVTAEILDGVSVDQALLVKVTADDDRTLEAETTGVSVGVVAAGASVSTATIGGTTRASMGNNADIGNGTGAVGGVTLDASATHAATANARAAKGGLGLAASGTVATATINPTVIASIGSGGQINVANAVSVQADAAAAARAESLGINVSAGVGLGASIAKAHVAPKVTASVGTNTSIDAGNIIVQAKQSLPVSGRSAYAAATGASGGLLLGANATWSEAKNTGIVKALIGNGSTLNSAGAVKVAALNVNSQLSDVAGFSGGLVAVGANFAHAESNTLTEADLGNLVKVSASSLEVSATGNSTNHAHGIAGSGGLVSAPFSEASTSTTSRTYARTGTGSSSRTIDVGTLLINAQQTSEFNSWMRNTNASLVGVSGANVSNVAHATTEAHLGASARAEADNIVMNAANTMYKRNPSGAKLPGSNIDVPEWNVNSSSGGLIDVPAAGSTTTITTHAVTQVGTNAQLTQSGDRFNPGSFKLDASNRVEATDKVKMASGGAVSAATGASLIKADTNNATVRIGNGATLSGVGDIRMGARSIATLHAQTAVDIWGAVGVAPFGESLARFSGNNAVEIGNANITSLNDIRLSAGANSDGVANQLSSTARSDVFNNTVIPVNRDPVADAIINTQSRINIADGAQIGAVRHVMLYAEKGSASSSGVGIGKDLWREALAAVANAFGADVSFETRTGRSIVNQSANVVVDGDVRVGIHRKQWLTIDSEGNVTSSDGMSISEPPEFKAIAEDILERIGILEDLIRQYNVDGANASSDAGVAVAAYRSEIRFLERKLQELGFRREAGEGGFTGVTGVSPLEVAQETLAAMGSTQEVLVRERNALVTDNTNRTTQNTNLTSANTGLTQQNVSLVEQRTGLIAQRDALVPEAEGYQTQYDDLTGQINQRTSSINTNTATINSNNDTISANNGVIDENNLVIADRNGRITGVTGAISALNDEITAGLYSDQPVQGPMATFLTVDDAVARLGNIYVRADNLSGSGVLDAPGDAEIAITNNSANFLILNSLTIPPDEGGRVYFNSIDVLDNADINTINRVGGANFAIQTADSQVDENGVALPPQKPRIVVTSTYNPLSPENLGATPDPDAPRLAPDIILRGDVSNLRGLVKIDSVAGSIRLEQKRDANGNVLPETASVRADQVEIKTSNGDFVQSYTDTFFHVAGAPLTVTPGDPELDFAGNISKINRTGEAATSGIVANGSVLIAARYLNINGTIQSGIAEWGVRIPANATVTVNGANTTFAAAQAHYANLTDVQRAAQGAEFYTVSGATVDGLSANTWGDWEKVSVLYNAKEDRLELAGVQVQGGYIELFGQIFNTNKDGGGKLRVLDGYGQINIDNQTTRAMWVNTLDTGRGVKGEINITNIVGIDANGVPIIETTRFTRGENGARTGGYYDPTNGLRYAMTVGYDQVKEDFYRYSQTGWFGSAILEGKKLDQYRINSIERSNDPLSQGEYLGLWLAGHTGGSHYNPAGSATYGVDGDGNGYIAGGRQQTTETSSLLTPGRSWRNCTWWTLCIHSKHYQEFTVTTGTKTTITDSVRADYRIAIEYIGFDEGKINVASVGDVVINGSLNNRNGDTSISSSSGSITQNGDFAIVGGNDIKLNAANGVGTANQALQLYAKGVLDATSTSGLVNLRQMVGDLRVGNIGGAGVTNVKVSSARDVLGVNANSLIQGHRVELLAENGKIGDLTGNAPLKVSTGYSTNQADWHRYGLKASARGDINLQNVEQSGVYTGDLLLVSVESQAGDVRIQTSGSAIDNNPYETTDTRTEAELADLWDSLRLRGDGAVEKADEAVEAFESGKSNNYALYWQFRALQEDGGATYDEGFAFSVSDAERAALIAAGMSASEISAFEANRTAQYQQLHAEVGGLTDSHQEGFRYVASAEEEASIRRGAVWSDQQLILSVGAGLLKNTTSTVTTIKDANIIGRNVELIAGGDIGSFNPQMEIDLSAGLDQLTMAQRAALAAVERGDAVFDGSIIRLNQWRPVNVSVSSGAINASSGGLVFLGSQGDLRVDQVSAAGGSRIKVAGSIINAASDPVVANVTASSLILEAANGGIGSATDEDGKVEKALKVNITSGDGIVARAAGDIWIEADSDLTVDTMYSRGDIRLDAAGSILDFQEDDSNLNRENNIRARNVYLSSINGSIGTAGNALEVGVNANGGITAITQATGQGVYLNGPTGEHFNIVSVQSGDAIELSSATAMRINGVVTGPGPISLVAGEQMILSELADVHSVVGGIQLSAKELLMQDDGTDAARLRSDTGTIAITTAGDAVITGIETGNGSANAVRITSGGDILDGGDTRTDIVANSGADATLTLIAEGSIGGGNPLEIDVSMLNGEARNGGVNLAFVDSVTIGSLQAHGEIDLSAGGDIRGDLVRSTDGRVQMQASNLNVREIEAHDEIVLTASGDIESASVTSTDGRVEMHGTNLHVAKIDAHGEIVLTADQDILSDSITSRADKVELHSIAGNLHVAEIKVATGVFLFADRISATVWGTGLSPIGGSMTGYGGAVASSINVDLASASGFDFDSVSMRRGSIDMLLGDLWINDLFVGNRATITNAQTRMLIDQDRRTLQGYDIQLYPEGRSFSVGLSRNLIDTDAFVIGRSPDHQTVTPDRYNLSSVEATERFLSVLMAKAPVTPAPDAPHIPELIAFSGTPVSLDDDTCEETSSEPSCE